MVKIFFFDTETTGFPRGWKLEDEPHIVEIWGIVHDTLMGHDHDLIFTERFNPGVHIPEECSNIHWIKDEDVKDCPPWETFWTAFVNHTKAADYIVGHNVEYDMKMIYVELRRFMCVNTSKSDNAKRWFKECEAKLICTKQYWTDLCKLPGNFGNYKWPRLNELHQFLFNSEFENAHSAAADILATQKCFDEMVSRGIISLK